MSKVIYDNPLACENDIKDFVLEGEAEISFDGGAFSIRGKERRAATGSISGAQRAFPLT